MTICRKLPTITLLLALGMAAWGESAGGSIADQLIQLRQQQRQEQMDISQYETSIRLLSVNRSAADPQSPALEALQAQLKQSQGHLKSLEEKELLLEQQLNPGAVAAPIRTAPLTGDAEAQEVARLKQLLKNYRLAELAAADQVVTNSESDTVTNVRTDANYAFDTVRLSASDGLAAILHMDEQLTNDSISSQLRELDIIFHIEVRRDGKLISSSSFSLKALGKSQYVGKVNLEGGSATVNVRKNVWIAELSPAEANDYLITLNMLNAEQPEMHFVSVADLKTTQVKELPAWVPYIGTLGAAPEQP